LLVETLGEAGLRFCNRIKDRRSTVWEESAAFPVADFKDAAGSGDWCTAGLLCRAGGEGLKRLLGISNEGIRDALRFGQALAAWNCGFEGARGGMYGVDRAEADRQIAVILGGPARSPLPVRRSARITDPDRLDLCPACGHEGQEGAARSAPGKWLSGLPSLLALRDNTSFIYSVVGATTLQVGASPLDRTRRREDVP
jgi:fructokinase